MISTGRQIAVYEVGAPVDMRKSFNTLSALVVTLGREVLSGHFFLFVSRDRKRAEVLFSTVQGCVCRRR